MSRRNRVTGDYRSTLAGVVLACVEYLSTAGARMPRTPEDWWALGLGVAIAVTGAALRDETVGLAPKPAASPKSAQR